MKFLFLMRRQYSKFFIRELIIIIQITILVALFTPTVTEMLHLFSVDKLANQFTTPAVYFQASTPYQIPERISEQDHINRLTRIEECSMVNDAGYVAHGGFSLNKIGTSVIFYNDALVQNIRLDIKEGKVISESASSNQISVLINETMADIFSVGDIFSIDQVRFPVSSQLKNLEFIVAGIIKGNSYYYTMRGGASHIQLESIGGKPSSNENIMIATTNFEVVPDKDIMPSCMLFTEDMKVLTIEVIDEELTGLGSAASIEEMRKNSIHRIVLENPLLFVSAIMLMLLCMTGVSSYAFLSVVNMRKKFSVYYICGMSWRKSLFITIVSLTVLICLAFLVAIGILPFIWERIEFKGLLYSSLLIVFLYMLSITVAVARYRTLDPMALLRKGD